MDGDFKSYSQYKEDLILKDILDKSGTFLEIGSYHPTVFSNTRFLVERGWFGVYVDGSPSALSRFVDEYITNNNIKIIQALIGNEHKIVKFYDSNGDGISSTDLKHKEKWEVGGSKFKEIYSHMITPNILYDLLPPIVDFVNIDVEGQSATLATLIDYDKLQTKIVCIEHDNVIDMLNSHMSKFNFNLVYVNGANVIYKR